MSSKAISPFLDTLIDYEKVTSYSYDAMKLDRMRALLKVLDNPQEAFQSIHVAGTRGKGSTSAMIYSILRESGFSVGLYTSPHLVSRLERIRVADGEEDRTILEDELFDMVQEIRPLVERLSEEGWGRFTFFEVFTAMSFLYFKKRGVEIAIVEVGMGGRLDATNTLSPIISVVMPISYDHTDKLGKTLTQIAREKAEIFKKGTTPIVGEQGTEPLSEILKVGREKGLSPLQAASQYTFQIQEKKETGTHFTVQSPEGKYPILFLPLLGEHQVKNALVAIAVSEVLSRKNFKVPKVAIQKGLASVSWPGRIQVIQQRPTIILDGAQNGASAVALKEVLNTIYAGRPVRLILGISSDKEADAVCRILCPLAENVIVTKADSTRAMSVEKLMQHVSPYTQHYQIIPSLEDAIVSVSHHIDPKGVIVVTGSLYLVGEALSLFEKGKLRGMDQRASKPNQKPNVGTVFS